MTHSHKITHQQKKISSIQFFDGMGEEIEMRKKSERQKKRNTHTQEN